MISKELNFSEFILARIRLTALRTFFCPSKPKTIVLISPAMQKKVHPASWILRSNAYASRSLTNRQPVAQGSLSNRSVFGKNVPSLKRMVPVLIVSAIRNLLSVYSDPCFVLASVARATGTAPGTIRAAAFTVDDA